MRVAIPVAAVECDGRVERGGASIGVLVGTVCTSGVRVLMPGRKREGLEKLRTVSRERNLRLKTADMKTSIWSESRSECTRQELFHARLTLSR